jgi:FUN14 family protein
LSIENLVFSAGGGFLFGAVAGYAIKKVMKIAAIIIGLFVVGLFVSIVQRMDRCEMGRNGKCDKNYTFKCSRTNRTCAK